MANTREVSTKFTVDISQFKKGIDDARNQVKLANAQFKEASSKLDDWAKTTDGLQAKIKQLNTIIEAQNSKIKNLKGQQEEYNKASKEAEKQANNLRSRIVDLNAEYEDSVELYGKNSEQSKQLKGQLEHLNKELLNTVKAQESNAKSSKNLELQILNEQASLNKTQKELERYSKSLDDLNASNSKTQSSFEKMEDTINSQEKELSDLKKKYTELALEQKEETDEAKQLAKQISSLSEELNENKTKVNNAKKSADSLTKSLDDMGDEAKNTEDGFTVMKGALADLTSNIIQSAVSGIKDLIGSFFDLVEATEEYRSMSAKLEGSAKNNGYAVEYATEKYKEMYAYLGDDQMATNAVTNLMGLQTNQETLNSLLDGATGVWASYGDSIPIESLTEAINETIQVGKVTGTFADTINWAKISNEEMAKSLGEGSKAQKTFNKMIADGETQEDAFSEALKVTSDEQERAKIVADFLNSTYGETKKTYDEMTGSIQETNKAEVELKETQAEIAEALSPVHNAFQEFKTNALEMMIPLVKTLADGFMNLKAWLEEHPAVMGILQGVVIGLASAFGTLAIALGIQALINGVSKAMAFLGISINSAMLPITLIVGAIAGLVAGFIYAWNNIDGFKEFWLQAWEQIKGALVNAWENFIKPTIQSLGEFIVFIWENYLKPTIQTIGEFLLWAWETIIQPTLMVLQQVFEAVFNKIVEIWNNNLKPTFEAIGRILKSVWETLVKPTLDVLLALFKGVFETIKILWETILQPVFKALGDILSAVWTLIVSPILSLIAQHFQNVFKIIEGLWNNVLRPVFQALGDFFSFVWNNFLSPTIDSVKNGFQDMAKTVTDIWDGLWGSIKGVINSILGGIEGMANGVVGGVNKVIDALNGLSFTIPDWVPGFGGNKFGFNLGHLSKVSLPRLAEGGLAKKNNPFMAVVGDNPTQDEIISPVNTIRSIIAEELREFMQGVNVVKGGSNISNISNNTTHQTFNQYITSPKSLSTLEIYRQSRNLLKGGKA